MYNFFIKNIKSIFTVYELGNYVYTKNRPRTCTFEKIVRNFSEIFGHPVLNM